MKRKTRLTPSPQAEIVNYGFRRNVRHLDIVLDASPQLPKSFRPQQLTLGVARGFRRSEADKLTTVSFPSPRYTKPKVRLGGRQVVVVACLDAAGMKAGAYPGTINISGPVGLVPATVDVTVNLKNRLFFVGLPVALIVAFFLMLYRSGKIGSAEKRRWVTLIKDPEFLASSAAGLIAAVIAAGGVYAGDVAWGDDALPSFIALGSTTLAAAGVQNLIATVRGK